MYAMPPETTREWRVKRQRDGYEMRELKVVARWDTGRDLNEKGKPMCLYT
jgi:hypothetical protein